MLSLLFAASFSFTASATGVEKGTPVEFMFAGADTDRGYETMFLLDAPISDFARDLENAGLRRGFPQDNLKCDLWPVGCTVELDPPITNFVSITAPDGIVFNSMIYTGGVRSEKGAPIAANDMPGSVMSFYSLPQSLFVMNGLYPQGDVYNSFQAAKELKKGEKVRFTLHWNNDSMPDEHVLVLSKTNAVETFKFIHNASAKRPIVLKIGFDESLTIAEASDLAAVLDRIDSLNVKINGIVGDGFFYRAFNPPVKWRERQNRLAQPFELMLSNSTARLVFIEEDWTVEGDDPKLTPREIALSDAAKYPKTDTCFIFANRNITLRRILEVRRKISAKQICNWYIFIEE